jgi:prepilin-type N-terminal cleavage/methylation domain-containing protein
MKKIAKNKGFTLIEILVVIGIIAVLATIVIVAINPAKQFAQARITQRTSNVGTILNAIGQRLADNKGVFAGTYVINSVTYTCGPLPTTATNITTATAADTTTQTGALGGCLTPTYIPSLPTDPTWTSADGTNTLYNVVVDAIGRVTVCSTAALETAAGQTAQTCITR